jgi:hypothetical protein
MTRATILQLRRWLVLPLVAWALSAVAAQADFRGGGAVFGFSETCAQHGWPVPGGRGLRVRYAASEDSSEMPSQVTLDFGSGTEHFALRGPLAPSGSFFVAAGRQIWTRSVFYPTRPLIRVVQRQIVEKIDAAGSDTIQNARVVLLRMRIQNFNNLPDCAVTVSALLQRTF